MVTRKLKPWATMVMAQVKPAVDPQKGWDYMDGGDWFL